MTKKLNFKNLTLKYLIISLVIPVVFFSISLMTMNDYGETTDEKFDQHIGEFYYYQWENKGVKGLIERFIPLQRNYGPLFDIIVVASNDLLHQKHNIIENSVASYHFPVIIISSLAIWVVFILSYLNWGLGPAFLSSLTLVLLPRFIGDSQNNLKDTPTMTFFSLTLLFYFLAAKKRRFLSFLIAGVFLGLTYAIKINALIILPIVCFWFFIENKFNPKKTQKFIGGLGLSLVIALITILIVWPYYRYDPPARFIETYNTFKNHVWNEYILYLGQHYRGHEVPWHYPIVMLGVTTPFFYLVLLVAGFILGVYFFYKNHSSKSFLLLLFTWLIFPPLTQVVSGAPMYDGIRHFLVILPPLSILIGFAIWQIGKLIWNLNFKYKSHLFVVYFLIILISYLNILRLDIRLHPYQIVYFNELIEGVKGAYGKFDLDYWGQSLKQAAEWINENLPSGSRIWLTIPMAHHFPIDRSRFYLVDRYPEYKVNLIRGMLKTWDTEEDYLHPKRKPIYSINVDEVDILQIFEYKENLQVNKLSSLGLAYREALNNGGVKMTVFADNKFEGSPIESVIASSIGFQCTNNNYNNKAISIRYEGYLKIVKDDIYCFKIASDDDSLLKLNDANIIINPSMGTSINKISLSSGYYKLQLDYENNVGSACLGFMWSTNDCKDLNPIPIDNLYY